MSKVTSKLQVTIPKAVADAYGIEPGSDVDWVPAGEVIRLVPRDAPEPTPDSATRLELFDAATERQRQRQRGRKRASPRARGWRREDLYDGRGRAR